MFLSTLSRRRLLNAIIRGPAYLCLEGQIKADAEPSLVEWPEGQDAYAEEMQPVSETFLAMKQVPLFTDIPQEQPLFQSIPLHSIVEADMKRGNDRRIRNLGNAPRQWFHYNPSDEDILLIKDGEGQTQEYMPEQSQIIYSAELHDIVERWLPEFQRQVFGRKYSDSGIIIAYSLEFASEEEAISVLAVLSEGAYNPDLESIFNKTFMCMEYLREFKALSDVIANAQLEYPGAGVWEVLEARGFYGATASRYTEYFRYAKSNHSSVPILRWDSEDRRINGIDDAAVLDALTIYKLSQAGILEPYLPKEFVYVCNPGLDSVNQIEAFGLRGIDDGAVRCGSIILTGKMPEFEATTYQPV